MKLKKKKAFTLTELLVVVVVIGVLSAVTLPKFSKVMETRKTTEAEDLMSAVRTEQEKRCSLDKPYLTDINDLKDILPTRTTKNYDYSLTSDGLGILASSKGKYNYTLSMPSYKDGRLCCEGAECSKLNKDYPLCDDLRGAADFATGSECSAGIVPPTSEPENPCPPEERPTETTRPCDTGCGEQTSVVTCEDDGWQVNWVGTCKSKPAAETAPCGNCYRNSSALKKKAYSCKNGTWTKASSWDMSACGSYICGNNGPTPSGTAQSTQFIVFSGDSNAYLRKDSALCGYACGANAIKGTKITKTCSSQEEANRICSQGGVGCVSGTIPTNLSTTCTYSTSTSYTCHIYGPWNSSCGQIYGFPSQVFSGNCGNLVERSMTYTCEGNFGSTGSYGSKSFVTLNKDCTPYSGQVYNTDAMQCYGQGGGAQTCQAIYSSSVSGYVCSNYAGTYSGCSSSSSSSGGECGASGCGAGPAACGLGSGCGATGCGACGAW